MACVCAARPAGVNTVMFVDVDGVLNVGIKDPPQSPLNFSFDNVDKAFRTGGECSSKIVEVYNRQQEGQTAGRTATYSDLLCDMATGASEVLLGRLVEMLHRAGRERLVVLASSWRTPRHAAKVQCLEQHIGRILGEPFRFDDRTMICKDSTPGTRLSCIGDYVANHCASWHKSARVLVLEDFHINPMSGWSVDGIPVRCTTDAEAYLTRRAPPTHDLSVMLVHTFSQWTTASGLHVQIGCGISQQQVEWALEFIAKGKELCKGNTRELEAPVRQQQQRCRQLLWWNMMSLKVFSVPQEWDCNRSVTLFS